MSNIASSISSEANDAIDFLAEMGQEFSSSANLQKTLSKALGLIVDYVKAEGGALFFLNEEGDYLDCITSVGPVEITGLRLKSDQGIVGKSVEADSGRIVRNVSDDPDFHTGIDEKTGYLFESGNPKSLSEKILKALNLDDTTLKIIGIEGRKNIVNKFNVEKMCFSTYSEYKKLIN